MIIFPDNIGTIEGVTQYLENCNDEEYTKFKHYFYGADHYPEYENLVIELIKNRESTNG